MVVLGCGRCGWCGRSDGGDEVGREGSKGGMGKVVRRGGGRDANPHSPFKRTFLY